MKPFNLEKALAGDPVSFKNSKDEILLFNHIPDSGKIFVIYKMKSGAINEIMVNSNGKHDYEPDKYSLVMD